MEKELNIAAILKDKPNTKVWSDTFGELTFEYIDNQSKFPISLTAKNGNSIDLTKDGRYYCDVDGVLPCIVPSKEMRDWEKFAWKKGDVIINGCGFQCIFKEWASDDYTKFNGCYSNSRDGYEDVLNAETMKFQKIDNNTAYGYIRELEKKLGGKFNLETLQIDKQPKPEFKDGDVVHSEDYMNNYTYIYKEPQANIDICYCYKLSCGYLHICNTKNRYDCTLPSNIILKEKTRLATDSEKQQLFDALAKKGKVWNPDTRQIEDLPKKCELKTFDKVLIKDHNNDRWEIDFFAYYDEANQIYITTSGNSWNFCLPYNDSTKHLLGTTDEWKGGK